MYRPEEGSTEFRDWMSFAARHTILILKKSPACPALTKPLTQQSHQDMYDKLVPLLRAGGMTYRDLDIDLTGPRIDGRTVTIKPSGKSPVAGNVLPYGKGLPKGLPQRLVWNSEITTVAEDSKFELSLMSDESTIAETFEDHKGDIIFPQLEQLTYANASQASRTLASQELPEYQMNTHIPQRASNFLSVRGPIVYNIQESADLPSHSLTKSISIPKLDRGLDRGEETSCGQQNGSQLLSIQSNNLERNEGEAIKYIPKTATWSLPKPVPKTSEISAFSADAAWNASFVLAPNNIMNAQNLTHARWEGVTESASDQQWWKWDDISKAPLLVSFSLFFLIFLLPVIIY